MKAIQEKTVQDDSKQAWTKPELEIVSIKKQTLNFVNVGADIGIFS